MSKMLTEQDMRDTLMKNEAVRKQLHRRIMHYAPFKRYKVRKPRRTAGELVKNLLLGTGVFAPKTSRIDWEKLALEAALSIKTQQFIAMKFNRRG